METRICKVCSEEKPLDIEHFHHNYSYKDGWTKECRICYNIKQKEQAKKRYHNRKKELNKGK